jgi:hypothetical protein
VSGGDPRDDLLGRLIEPVRESVGFNPGGVSRWMRRRHRWAGVFIGVFCVAGFGCFVALFVSIGRGGAVLSLAIGGASLPVLGGVLAMVALTRARRQERSAADAACGYACPNCLYDLSAERVERCSECGQRVIYDGLPVLWEGASWRRAWSDPVDKSTGFSRAGLSAWEVVMRRWSRALSLLIPVVCFAPWQTVFHGLGSLAVGVRTGLGGVATVVAMVVLLGPVFVLMFRKKKQLERALRASGGLACPACLHDLSGASVERCPACGQRVEYATLARSWRVRMRVLGIPGPEGGGEDGVAVVTDAPARPAGSES